MCSSPDGWIPLKIRDIRANIMSAQTRRKLAARRCVRRSRATRARDDHSRRRARERARRRLDAGRRRRATDFVSDVDRGARARRSREIVAGRHPDARCSPRSCSPDVQRLARASSSSPTRSTARRTSSTASRGTRCRSPRWSTASSRRASMLNVADRRAVHRHAPAAARGATAQPIARLDDHRSGARAHRHRLSVQGRRARRRATCAMLPRVMRDTAGHPPRRRGGARSRRRRLRPLRGVLGAALAPWDIAAGMLLVREAGGIVTDAGRRALPASRTPRRRRQSGDARVAARDVAVSRRRNGGP